jgi:hypothetical protein
VTVDPEIAAKYQPSPHPIDVEAALGRSMALRGLLLAPIVIAVAWLIGGEDAAFASAIGVAVVVVNFVVSGLIMSRAARISLSLYHAAALFGFFIRLGLITLTMLLVAQVIEIDRPAMGIAAVVSYFVLLSMEAVAVSKGKKKELEWT